MNKEPKKYTREWFVEQGRKGGFIIKEKYGLNHFSKMGKKRVDNSKAKIKEVDIKGSFKSDDEIGFFFQQIKYLQDQLNNFKINE